MAQIFSSPFGTGLNGLANLASDVTFSSLISAKTGCTGSAGSQTLTVTSVTGFVAGQRIVIQKAQGTTTTNTGSWEINYILAVGASTLTLAIPLVNSYQDSGNDQSQVWTWYETTNANLSATKTLSLDTWDSDTGGFAFISCRGRFTVSGTIDGLGKGYAAGAGAPGAGGQATQGSSENGAGSGSQSANGSGGGGGKGGGGAGTGGTAYQTDATLATRLVPGGGGGGGNANNGAGPAGGAGGGVIIIYCKELYVATGGIIRVDGAAGNNGPGNQGGGGGGGGGSILIKAERVVNNGTITSLGGTHGVGSSQGDGGGGGAGATNGSTSAGPGGNGGDGANGSIRIEAGLIINNGTITPTQSTTSSLLPWSGRLGLIG